VVVGSSSAANGTVGSVGMYELGASKIFIRHPKALFALETLRSSKLGYIASILQGAVTRYLFRWVWCRVMQRSAALCSD
jgi:myosin heavy subunit